MTTQPQYSEEERLVLSNWFDNLINTYSDFLECTISTPEQVLQHVKAATESGFRLGVIRPTTPTDDWSSLPKLVDDPAPAPASNVVIEEVAEISQEAWDNIKPTGNSYIEYLEACRARNEAIEAARLAWKEAIIEREAALRFLDADVTTKRNAYQLAKEMPVPVAPAK